MNALIETEPSSAEALRPNDLQDFEGEVRISDARLAVLLGYAQPRYIRDIIRTNQEELLTHGVLRRFTAKPPSGSQGGRPERMIMLNEAQAILVTMFSRTQRAAEARRQIVQVFIAWRHGHLVPAQPEIELTLPAPERRKEAPELETAGQRLFAEFKRLYGTDDWRKLVPILSHIVSKARLIAIQRGDGVMAALKHDNAWVPLVCSGIDLRYVLNNSWTFTPEERELIANIRALGEQGQAMALQSFARQIGTLCTNPDAPLLLDRRP